MATSHTGRARVRPLKRLFRRTLLVVQIEQRVQIPTHRYPDEGLGGGVAPAVDRTEWRDARVEDLSCFKLTPRTVGTPDE